MCEIGFHAGQALLLLTLDGNTSLSQIEICNQLEITAASVNVMVRKLCEAGLVKRIPCPNDGRVMKVRLTKSGKTAVPAIQDRLLQLDNSLTKNFTDTELLLLPILLEKLHTNLKDISK